MGIGSMLWACNSTLYSVWCAVYPQIAYAKSRNPANPMHHHIIHERIFQIYEAIGGFGGLLIT